VDDYFKLPSYKCLDAAQCSKTKSHLQVKEEQEGMGSAKREEMQNGIHQHIVL
jgi:hypothetical protein